MEKLGVPLLSAMAGHADPAADPRKEAERLAELLGKSVQASLSLGQVMDMRNDAQADSVRLALAALASSLLGGQYAANGRAPGDKDIERAVSGLQTVVMFADSFAAEADQTGRLQMLDADLVPGDENQIQLWLFRAMTPAVSAIAAYSFGRPEKKLAQEVTGRLLQTARALREDLFPAVSAAEQRSYEMAVFKSLAHVYSECHLAETRRLFAMDEKLRAETAQKNSVTMDSIWSAFDLRAEMLAALVSGMTPENAAASSGGQGGRAPSAPPPQTPPPQVQQIQPAAAPPPAQAAANPMSFFKPGAKQAGGGQ